jgi:superfamily II RNA helicase
MNQLTPLTSYVPRDPTPESLLDNFLRYTTDQGLELYPAQEEAILEFFGGNHVILSTPTGSGKSLVALAAHFDALSKGERSFYSAPIKALVSEKFFSLCKEFGPDNVGMITGDASVNATAPIICCTQEIVANLALRHGADAPIDNLVVDEFHYYSDRDRGWAWQVPLLELKNTQFLLMSATLGPSAFFADDLQDRTFRSVASVSGTVRPVPLSWEYRETPLLESIEESLALNRAPIYVVHFTQRAATERAQALTSINILDKEEKQKIIQEIGDFKFDSPFGKEISRYIKHGIGVHHAGLLPKYRLLVERLAQAGLLKLICGTDTLGVGVNIPIRTVLFTQLCKYDGRKTSILTVRDFQQIAGRAGRRGFDDEGFVWCQAPEHVIDNEKALKKAGDDTKKKRKIQRKKPPERGYVHWDSDTFKKLITGQPATMQSRFEVSHSMLLNVLDRPGDGATAMKNLLTNNHETRVSNRSHIRRAISIYRSLLAASVVEKLSDIDSKGRSIRLNIELQSDFNMTQALSPFVLDALEFLNVDDPVYCLDLLSVVESVLEDPKIIITRQIDLARTELLGELKSEGVEYEDRISKLDEVEHPKPLKDFLYSTFDAWSIHHPWLTHENIRPKSVARDLFERAMTFREFINHYGLKSSEGVVLRYLTDCYKALNQTVPIRAKTEEVYELTEWLGTLIRQVDSSLIDEWERLKNPEIVTAPTAVTAPFDITLQHQAFLVMVRNALFRWLQLLSKRDYENCAKFASAQLGSPESISLALEPYWQEYDVILVDPEARSAKWFISGERSIDRWLVTQIICDPQGFHEWRVNAEIDLVASRLIGEVVLQVVSVAKLE